MMRGLSYELLRPCRRYGADPVLARAASSLTRRMLARFNASELDRLLACGSGPVTQPLEGARAAYLLRRRQRVLVAEGWRRRLVAARERRLPGSSSTVRVEREEVLMAEPAILRLIVRLERDALIEVRVIARARLLLVDPGSVVYSCQRPGGLRDAVRQIAGAPDTQRGMRAPVGA